jgi:hypothetical protein
MNDTLVVKDVLPSGLTAADFGATARSFARITSTIKSEEQRKSSHIDSLSPSILRIGHSPATPKNGNIRRSLFGLRQMLCRKDAQSNQIGMDQLDVNFSSAMTSGVTLAEYRTAVLLKIGALLENNGAMIDQVYEQQK